MGSDPSPFMANLFLFTYESKWELQTKRRNLYKARIFTNTFRFIDDLCAINDNCEFEKSFKETYAPELVLKKENTSNLETLFLDLNINVKHRDLRQSYIIKEIHFLSLLLECHIEIAICRVLCT